MLFACEALAAKAPPLPQWNAEDEAKRKKGEIVVGMALLTDRAPQQGDEKESTPQVEVIIEAVEAKPSLNQHEQLGENSEISGQHLGHYFGEKPTDSLVDPQQLLSMQERADLKYALELHHNESDLPIYVYLFDAGQRVPKDYSPQGVYEKLFGEDLKPVVLVYYYMGAPERSEFLLAGGASDQVPQWQVRELLWNAAHKAREKSDVFDQLDGFVGQLSMRLFWIEEILSELMVVVPVKAVVDEGKVQAGKAQKLVGMIEERVGEGVSPVVLSILGCLVVIGGGGLYLMNRKLTFPEKPSSERLGGKRGAKAGGILSYRNPRVPPTQQKEQFGKDFF
ncbi:hypothetical protein [Rubritalea tangerina]|uniref:TPM domain-containing protein n=1 Tax=Rubritalea tangerina TaxID=430798 RepID=A0ABW4ZAV8_9BACT